MKTSRRRLDVDVEELDRMIDSTENGPLSKADRQKLKTTLHALLERVVRKRNSEKTSAVLEPNASTLTEDAIAEPKPPGNWPRAQRGRCIYRRWEGIATT